MSNITDSLWISTQSVEPTGIDPDIIQFFAQHFICISCTDKTPSLDITSSNQKHGRHISASAFVLSIEDRWFLVTAGHVLEQFELLLKNGHILSEWRLDDTVAKGARSKILIPFDYIGASKQYINDKEAGIDIGLIYLQPMYRKLLEANGIIAITEQAWQHNVPDSFDALWLLGIPLERVQEQQLPSGVHISKGYTMLPISATDHIPEHIQTPFPRFYGTLTDIGDLRSVEGMSGGPIFGCKVMTNGEVRYWVVAVQSGWLQKQRLITACPILRFAEWVFEEFNEDDTVQG